MKRYILEKEGQDDKVFEIKYRKNSDWPMLWYQDTLVGTMISEEECRRVAWSYLVGLGLNPEPLTDKDFKEIDND